MEHQEITDGEAKKELLIEKGFDLSAPKEKKIDKINWQDEIENLVYGVNEGYFEAIETFKLLKKIEILLSDAKEEIKEAVLSECEDFEKHDLLKKHNIEISQSGRYDYSVNYEYNELIEKKKEMESEMKANLKNKDKFHFDVDTKKYFSEETGEEIFIPTFKANAKAVKVYKNK